MDADFREIVALIASRMSRAHAALRRDYCSGVTKPLIDHIRSDVPLEQSEREYIALLLSGKFGRQQHHRKAIISNVQKQRIVEKVRQKRELTKTEHPRKKLAEIYVAVADEWNSDPSNGQHITPTQVEQIYRKWRPENRKNVKTK